MNTYAKNCEQNLLVNRVQITENVCKTEQVTTNGWGIETGRNCIEWIEVGTGLYANPKLYAAYNIVEGIIARNRLKDVWKELLDFAASGNANNLGKLVVKSEAFQADMQQLITQNGCENKALKRFEDNLIQFANNEQPVLLDGTIKRRTADLHIIPQDMTQLVEDLVTANSGAWAFKYIRNSVGSVNIVSKDYRNLPAEISATYLFEGLSGNQRGLVKITFKEGIPDCIYFPNYVVADCKTPDRQVIADYLAGKYVNE